MHNNVMMKRDNECRTARWSRPEPRRFAGIFAIRDRPRALAALTRQSHAPILQAMALAYAAPLPHSADVRTNRERTMTALKPQTSYDDFSRLDIRIGKVVDIQPFPRARNPSWKVGVDVGADRVMWSSAQITNYAPADLLGSLVVCVCNFGPKNIAGFTSELLIL